MYFSNLKRLLRQHTQKVFVSVFMLLIVSACGDTKLKYQDLPVDQLYIEAQKFMDFKQYPTSEYQNIFKVHVFVFVDFIKAKLF